MRFYCCCCAIVGFWILCGICNKTGSHWLFHISECINWIFFRFFTIFKINIKFVTSHVSDLYFVWALQWLPEVLREIWMTQSACLPWCSAHFHPQAFCAHILKCPNRWQHTRTHGHFFHSFSLIHTLHTHFNSIASNYKWNDFERCILYSSPIWKILSILFRIFLLSLGTNNVYRCRQLLVNWFVNRRLAMRFS